MEGQCFFHTYFAPASELDFSDTHIVTNVD